MQLNLIKTKLLSDLKSGKEIKLSNGKPYV